MSPFLVAVVVELGGLNGDALVTSCITKYVDLANFLYQRFLVFGCSEADLLTLENDNALLE